MQKREDGVASITPTSKVSIALLIAIVGGVMALLNAAYGFRDEIAGTTTTMQTSMASLGERVQNMDRNIGELKTVLVRQGDYSAENAIRIGRIDARVDVLEARNETFHNSLGERLAELVRRVEEVEKRPK